MIPKIKFLWDRNGRAKEKNALGMIELRITLSGKRKYITTGIAVQRHRWKEGEQVVTGIEEARQYNLILSRLRTRAIEIIGEMAASGVIDLDAIPSRIKSEVQTMSFLDFVELSIASEVHTLPHNTVKNHRSWLRQMRAWGGIVAFSDITHARVLKMDEWLRSRKLHDETIYDYHKHLRLYANKAVIEGFIGDNPYKGGRIELHHGAPRIDNYVTDEELTKIKQVQLSTPRLQHTRDLFVFQASTGMSYADIVSFDFTKVDRRKKIMVIDGRREKTGVPYHFVILEDGKKILERYQYKLPYLTNQKYNDYLKLLASACNIDKPISSHWARRTAGMRMLNNGVPMGVVSRILGHASIRTTEKAYAYLLNKTIDDEMVKFEKKMKRRKC